MVGKHLWWCVLAISGAAAIMAQEPEQGRRSHEPMIILPAGITWTGVTATAIAFPIVGTEDAWEFATQESQPVIIHVSRLPSTAGGIDVWARAIGSAQPIGRRIHITLRRLTLGGESFDWDQPDNDILAWALAKPAAEAGEPVDPLSVAFGLLPTWLSQRSWAMHVGDMPTAPRQQQVHLLEAVIPAGTELRFMQGKSWKKGWRRSSSSQR
ncbi:MAG: hypothetical protein N3A02_00285 [Rectinema sp.]|nr:hypothetical protein [Rectinema sp.]